MHLKAGYWIPQDTVGRVIVAAVWPWQVVALGFPEHLLR